MANTGRETRVPPSAGFNLRTFMRIRHNVAKYWILKLKDRFG